MPCARDSIGRATGRLPSKCWTCGACQVAPSDDEAAYFAGPIKPDDASRGFPVDASRSRFGEPAEQRVPFVFNSPHSGRYYPERFLAMTRLDRNRDPPVRGLLCRRTVRRARVALGAPMLAAQFPARLSRRQPRAVGTRSAHVRRAGAALRQHPLGARRRRARHRAASWSARGSTSIRAGCRWRRPSARIETRLQALSRDAEAAGRRAPMRDSAMPC